MEVHLSDETKFKAILERAIDNGYRYRNIENEELYRIVDGDIETRTGGGGFWKYSLSSIVFAKPFAKAFWGEEGYLHIPRWQYYLQQLVLQDNYIDYLYSFIKENS